MLNGYINLGDIEALAMLIKIALGGISLIVIGLGAYMREKFKSVALKEDADVLTRIVENAKLDEMKNHIEEITLKTKSVETKFNSLLKNKETKNSILESQLNEFTKHRSTMLFDVYTGADELFKEAGKALIFSQEALKENNEQKETNRADELLTNLKFNTLLITNTLTDHKSLIESVNKLSEVFSKIETIILNHNAEMTQHPYVINNRGKECELDDPELMTFRLDALQISIKAYSEIDDLIKDGKPLNDGFMIQMIKYFKKLESSLETTNAT